MRARPLLEIAVDSLASALAAQQGGADRIELCGSLSDGGITPSVGFIATVRERIQLPVYILIRPRAGDFFYTDAEFELMSRDIEQCVQRGCDGVVVGALTTAGDIDPRCGQLIAAAKGLGVTFHRAFDACADRQRALEAIIELGCERTLTSGGCATAWDGAAAIAASVRQAAGRVRVMAGAGIHAAQLPELIDRSCADEFHASARRLVPSPMRYHNPLLTGLSPDVAVASVEEVQALSRVLATR